MKWILALVLSEALLLGQVTGAVNSGVVSSGSGGGSPASQTTFCRSTTGNDSYVCALTPALASYGLGTAASPGACVTLSPDTANTGAATINIDSLGVKNILNRSGETLVTGDLVANAPIGICYNGTSFYVSGDGRGSSSTSIVFTAPNYCDSNTGNDTYVCTLSPVAMSSYVTGACIILDGDTSNTGAATVNVDSLGAKSIRAKDGTGLKNNDVRANVPTTLCYNGTNYYVQGDGEGSTAIGQLVGTYANLTATCTTGQTYLFDQTDTVYQMAKCTATDTWGQMMYKGMWMTPPPSTGWTDNAATSGVTRSTPGGTRLMVQTGGGTFYWPIQYRTKPTAPYAVAACFVHNGVGQNNSTSALLHYTASGGDAGKFKTHEYTSNASTYPILNVGHWTNFTTFSAIPNTATPGTYGDPVCLCFTDDNTNINYYASNTPVAGATTWSFFYQRTTTNFSTADSIGFGMEHTTSAAQGSTRLVHWKESTSAVCNAN